MPKASLQLEIDFRVPCHDPITPREAAKALEISLEKVYQKIQSGELPATDISSDSAERPEYRIPLKNVVRILNSEHSKEMYWHFPSADPVTVSQARRTLGCSKQHVLNQIAAGEFPHATRIGNDFRIPLLDLVKYVERHREGSWS